MGNVVTDWFGGDFKQLDPLLQALHSDGGVLSGQVALTFGKGLAGVIGARLARKVGLPGNAGMHNFRVVISHQANALHWARQFDSKQEMVSVFTPQGNYPTGYWCESTGNLTLHLGVVINEGGWFWEQRKTSYRGLTIPGWLIPSTNAYKRISGGQYEFSVSFSLPVVGQLLCYQGRLTPEPES